MHAKEYILVVEDDDDIRSLLQAYLELEGYDVKTAINGHAALDALEQYGAPGLILLDLMMPEMNGFEFLEIKRKNTAYSNIPTVVVSAIANKGLDAIASGWLKKPIDLLSLDQTVKRHFLPQDRVMAQNY